jgi:hypothetical protein
LIKGPALFRHGDVGHHGQCASPGLLDQCGCGRHLLDPARAECDIGARLGERLRERHAEPGGRAGHDDDLAVEFE